MNPGGNKNALKNKTQLLQIKTIALKEHPRIDFKGGWH